ncbi:MAG TPA: hypothetical protein VH500_22965 [Nitrososphaeraceae archaeon]
MNQACSSIIKLDWHIKFVCILDRNGKLLVGQGRNIPLISISDRNAIYNPNNLPNTNLKIDELIELFLKHKNMYLFYSDYLLWVIESCKLHLKDSQNKNNSNKAQHIGNNALSYFEVSGYNNDDVKLAVTTVNDNKYRFLCIYFEPAYRIRNSFNGAREVFENLLVNISNDLQMLA